MTQPNDQRTPLDARQVDADVRRVLASRFPCDAIWIDEAIETVDDFPKWKQRLIDKTGRIEWVA